MVICVERGADLHVAQLMPLPLTVSSFSKIQIGFYLSGTRSPGVVPDKGPLNGCVCVSLCVYYLLFCQSSVHTLYTCNQTLHNYYTMIKTKKKS